MLWTIAAILIVCWLLGMVTFHALGVYVHVLLVLAIIAILIRIIQGRDPLERGLLTGAQSPCQPGNQFHL